MNQLQASPFISVVIPTYKRRQRLEAAIRSVQMQNYGDWELVVSDDEDPPGGTWHWLEEIAKHDYRIRPTLNHALHGQVANTNNGMAQARGPWIKLLHDDDQLMPTCLKHFAEVAQRVNDTVVLITANTLRSGKQDKRYGAVPHVDVVMRYAGNEVIYGMYIQQDVGGTVPSSMMVRASAFATGTKFNAEDVLPVCVDQWFKIRLLTKGDLVHIYRPLVTKVEDDPRSITSTQNQKALDKEFELIRELMLPLIDPAFNPPPLKVVQGQVRLIRAMHRLTRRHPLQALTMALSVWHPRAWWLALLWGTRRLRPGWCNSVNGAPIR
jgi:glycosyltransferase involved in cell wall biosynthesis